jgi:hypothetical protein
VIPHATMPLLREAAALAQHVGRSTVENMNRGK